MKIETIGRGLVAIGMFARSRLCDSSLFIAARIYCCAGTLYCAAMNCH
jgi:hypothetical protein